MGLHLKIDAEEQKNSFILEDCTGRYRFDNLTGWGSPNPEPKKITSSTLFITPPGRTSGPLSVDLTGNFPNEDFLGYEILPYMTGSTNNKLISGKYILRLEIVGIDRKGNEYSTSAQVDKVFINDVTCCLDLLQKKINKDALKDRKQQLILGLMNLLESANYSIKHELTDQASEIVELLKSQCQCTDC